MLTPAMAANLLWRLPLETSEHVAVLVRLLVEEAVGSKTNRLFIARTLSTLCQKPWPGRVVLTRRLVKRILMNVCEDLFKEKLAEAVSARGVMELLAHFFLLRLVPVEILASMLDDVVRASPSEAQLAQRHQEVVGFYEVLLEGGCHLDTFSQLDALFPYCPSFGP